MSSEHRTLVAYIDVDDTLVRSFGPRRMPMVSMIEHVRLLHSQGVAIYLWSTAGAQYAESTAIELGLSDCVTACLPKPHIIIDDQALSTWRSLTVVHPNEAVTTSIKEYGDRVFPTTNAK